MKTVASTPYSSLLPIGPRPATAGDEVWVRETWSTLCCSRRVSDLLQTDALLQPHTYYHTWNNSAPVRDTTENSKSLLPRQDVRLPRPSGEDSRGEDGVGKGSFPTEARFAFQARRGKKRGRQLRPDVETAAKHKKSVTIKWGDSAPQPEDSLKNFCSYAIAAINACTGQVPAPISLSPNPG